MAKRECPFCKEKVKENAIICKHCKSELPPLSPKNSMKLYHHWREIVLISVALGFLGGIYQHFFEITQPSPPSPQEIAAKQAATDSLDARTYAKIYVGKSLKAPTTAKWPNVMDFAVAPKKDNKGNPIKDVWEVSGYVDAQNSFGAMIRTQWYVKLKKVGDAWKLLEIKS